MADEKPSDGGGPMEVVFFVVGIFVVLGILWFANGGPSRADLRGIFLHPPVPLGTGGAYGPQPTINNPNNSNTQQ